MWEDIMDTHLAFTIIITITLPISLPYSNTIM
jgi:hypothetical protein